MNEITEKEYPIEPVWIFKSLFSKLLGTAFITVLIIGFNAPIYAIIIIILISYAWGVIYSVLNRGNLHFSLEKNFIVMHQGILSKKQTNIPYSVIQNIFLDRGIFDKIFGLSTLVIENVQNEIDTSGRSILPGALGVIGNKIILPCLRKENAEALKNILLQRMKENQGVDTGSGL